MRQNRVSCFHRSDAPPPAGLRIEMTRSSSQGSSREQWHSSSQAVVRVFGKPAAPPPAAGFFVLGLRCQRPSASCGSSSLSSVLSDDRVIPNSRTGRLNGKTEASRVSAISWIVARSGTAPGTVLLRVAWLKSEYLIFTVTVFPVMSWASQ